MSTPTIDRTACSAARHGTALAYMVDRCRCPDARDAVRIYRKRLRENRHVSDRVDATGTARRLQALAAIGWPSDELGRRLGCTDVAIQQWRRRRYPVVYRRNARRVAALYDRLSATPGPSSVTRARAARSGWVPPLLWEGIDIDDPAAAPVVDEPTPIRPRGRVDLDEVEHLEWCGLSRHEIAERLAVQPESIERARQRAEGRRTEVAA